MHIQIQTVPKPDMSLHHISIYAKVNSQYTHESTTFTVIWLQPVCFMQDT